MRYAQLDADLGVWRRLNCVVDVDEVRRKGAQRISRLFVSTVNGSLLSSIHLSTDLSSLRLSGSLNGSLRLSHSLRSNQPPKPVDVSRAGG